MRIISEHELLELPTLFSNFEDGVIEVVKYTIGGSEPGLSSVQIDIDVQAQKITMQTLDAIWYRVRFKFINPLFASVRHNNTAWFILSDGITIAKKSDNWIVNFDPESGEGSSACIIESKILQCDIEPC